MKKFKHSSTRILWGLICPGLDGEPPESPDTYDTRKEAREDLRRLRKDGLAGPDSRIARVKETIAYKEL